MYVSVREVVFKCLGVVPYGTHALICKLQMEIKLGIQTYLFCSILESATVRSEMEVVLRCGNDVQVDALTVVDFTMLYVVCLTFHCWCHVFHCWLLI